MKIEPVGNSRLVVREESGERVIAIRPSRRQWIMAPFLLFWLVGWTVGGTMAAREFVRPTKPFGGMERLFLGAWLGGWACGEVAVAGILLWMFFGRQILRVTLDRLVVRREILGLGRTRAYALSEIHDLSAREILGKRGSFTGQAILTFRYGSETKTAASGLDPAEADELRRQIIERASGYRRQLEAPSSTPPLGDAPPI